MQTQQQDIKTIWLKKVNEVLKGRTIVSVRYLSDKEMDLMGGIADLLPSNLTMEHFVSLPLMMKGMTGAHYSIK